MSFPSNNIVSWFSKFFGRSDCTFVSEEVLRNFPKSITIEFIPEFDDDDNPIIFICSPDYDGLISEAKSKKEAIENAQDAILTYFDVPRECADLIEFDIEDVKKPTLDIEASSIRVREFRIKKCTHA